MGIKRLKPTSPARRYQTYLTRDELTPNAVPEKSLLEPKKRISGRNSDGRITIRRRGGGHKRHYRIIDFKRDKTGIPGRVAQLEYDPNRSAHIALISYLDGEKRYILAPVGLKVGTMILSGEEADILPGNALPIKNIPLGTEVHNIEMRPGKGRPDGPFGGRFCSDRRERRRFCTAPHAVWRGPQGSCRLHGDRRPGRQHRARECLAW